jgi:hypothetical protein
VATVIKIEPTPSGFKETVVAEYHGWINPVPYAEILYLLGLYYGEAWLFIERNGPGITVIHQLVYEFACWFVYRDMRSPGQTDPGMDAVFGITTDRSNKSTMIAFLQSAIKNKKTGRRSLTLWSEEIIEELENYVQEVTESGQSFRFKGDGNLHDDRVMALAIAMYGIRLNPTLFDFDKLANSVINHNNASRTDREEAVWQTIYKEQAEADAIEREEEESEEW